jgi:electron transfer flavoprotein beta subunit
MILNKALVAIKKVINPYVPIKIKPDGSAVVTSNVRTVMNPFDEIALEEAVKLKNQGFIQEIIAVSIGDNSQDILLQALAIGADRAIFIKTMHNLTPLNIAKILKYLIEQHQINIAFLGKQAIDNDCNQTGQMLAGLLNWPQVCSVSKIMFNQELLMQLIIDQEIDNGIEKLQVTLPVVITILDQKLNDLKQASYISLSNLNQAKKKPIDLIELNNLNLNLNLNQINVLKTSLVPKRHGIKLSSVSELINKLKIDKVLI